MTPIAVFDDHPSPGPMQNRRLVACFAVSLALLAAGDVVAAELVVNVTGDGAGSCPATCTLRAAIAAANATPERDTITLPAGVYALTAGELRINDDLDLVGPQGTVAVIDGTRRDRVFCIGCLAGPTPNVTMSRVVIQHGLSAAEGGGIFNGGILTINDGAVDANAALSAAPNGTGGLGGGIFNAGGAVLTVNRTEVAVNDASDAGGGIRNEGTATLNDTRVLDNRASRDGGGIANVGTLVMTGGSIQGNQAIPGDGGGLSNERIPNDRTGTATLTNVFMKANYAETRGGGIFNEGTLTVLRTAIKLSTALAPGGGLMNTGTLAMINTSVSTNTSATAGGGLATTGTATLNNVTIAFNGSPDHGGGIDQVGGVLFVSNIIVAGNTAPNAPDCSGTLDSGGYNLVQNPAGCAIDGNLTGNILGADARLSPAGAPPGLPVTPDHALLAGSAAINAGNPAQPGSGANACPEIDQQGFARPQGGRCDIGAYESRCGDGTVDPAPDRSAEVCDDGNQDDADCCTATCTLTSPCGGTTTTTLPPLCGSVVDCRDDDPCTLKACRDGRCVSSLRPGYDGVDCRLGQLLAAAVCAPDTVAAPLGRTLRRRVTRIRNVLEASAGAGPKKFRRLVARAARQVEGLRAKVLKSGATPPACRERLLDLLEQRRRLVASVS